ncbi:MAG TPA: NADPH:quinone oxidoreductase family protein [Nevskiaceae bacterium]|nr:NADPH:quinone oxidoreductase family protein [Nevskiaceae bacterium]
MPTTYRAWQCDQVTDDVSGLRLREVQRAAVGPRDVRIAVHAAGVNFPDRLMAQGNYQHRPPLPFVPGLEGAGEILEAGRSAGPWRPGDRVCFQERLGAFAEEIVLPVESVRPIPQGLTMDEAACFTVTAMTAWVALVVRARLEEGETLLVHGARGGVGQACVQLGRHLGAQVIASASRPESLSALAAAGVKVVDASGSFRGEVMALTHQRGADVIADPVGGDVFDESVRCIAWGGRLLVLGFASGRIPSLAANRALLKGFSLMGVRAGEYARRDPAAGRDAREGIDRLAFEGVMRPTIGLRVPFERAPEALVALDQRAFTGKIVIAVR